MILRPARRDDCLFVWNLANDREVREAAFDTGAIPWEDHVKWFRERMEDPKTRIFIAEHDGVPVGLIRFEVEDNSVKVSLYIVREHRKRGCGPRVLLMGKDLVPGRKVAFIKEWNLPSIRAFQKGGYRMKERSVVQGEPVVVMESL